MNIALSFYKTLKRWCCCLREKLCFFCASSSEESNGSTMVLRQLPRFWLLNCCVAPQTEIARVRVDRSMIGGPTDFRHIGHMGANDLNASCSMNEVSSLLQSKGDNSCNLSIPEHLHENDIPIKV